MSQWYSSQTEIENGNAQIKFPLITTDNRKRKLLSARAIDKDPWFLQCVRDVSVFLFLANQNGFLILSSYMRNCKTKIGIDEALSFG